MNILSIIMLLIACLNVVFGGSLLWGILLIVMSSMLILVSFLLKNKLPGYAVGMIYTVGFMAYFTIAFICSLRASDNGLFAYEKALMKVEGLAEEDEASDALEIVEELIDEYGENDKLLLYKANLLLMKNKAEKAYEALENVKSNRSEMYFLLKANANYLLENYDEYANTLMEGARKNPGSYALNTSAGSMAAENANYFGATYFLTKALEIEPEGALASYCLAGVNYHAGNLEVAKKLMDTAYKGGINEKSIYAEDELFIWYKEAK